MTRKTNEIIADLRSEADFNDDGADEYPVKLLREAADRLEKSTMTSAYNFTPPTVHTSNPSALFRAGIEAYRDAISDGSIDELVTP